MQRAFPEYCYKDVAFGDPNRRNHVVRVDEIARRIPHDKRECYATIMRYPEEFREYVREHGTVKGYKGPCFADVFWLDVDDDDLGRSQQATVNVVGTLVQGFGVRFDDLRLYFTGKKGFHIGVPTGTFGVEPSKHLPKALAELARRVSEAAGVAVDLSIYHHVALLRLPNTINGKSGLFKVPLTFAELGGAVEDIRAMAKAPRPSVVAGPNDPNETLTRLFGKILGEVSHEEAKRVELPVLETGKHAECPRWDKVCIYRMMKGVAEGQRNNAALRIAVHLRQKGMPLDMATAALMTWNRHNQVPLEEVDVADVARRAYENPYDFGCHDPVLDRYCHEQCYLHPRKIGEEVEGGPAQRIYSVRELMEKYLGYVRELDKAKVSWGFQWLDKVTRRLAPGQVGCIMARAGVGKTALTLQLLRANSELGIPSLLCSLEQLGAEIWERMAQNAAELPGQMIEEGFYTDNQEFIETVGSIVEHQFEHVYVCDDDRLTVKQLKERVRAAEQKAGEKIRLLAVDYLGRMKGDGKDYYQKVSEIALGLKEVAKECELAVVVLVQVNRSGGRGAVEVTMDMARDSGQVEEAVDYAIGMWQAAGDDAESGGTVAVPGADGKPVFVPQGKDFYPIIIQVNKNRKGPKGESVRCGLIFRPVVMRFEELSWRPPADVPDLVLA